MKIVRNYAAQAHAEAGKLYDGAPYLVHLDRVFFYVKKYQTYAKEVPRLLYTAAYLHDVLEDCPGITFNTLAGLFGLEAAALVRVLTNYGARANDLYYKNISLSSIAVFLKLCDRLANVSYSVEKNNVAKIGMYYKENAAFVAGIGAQNYPPFAGMLDELKALFNTYKMLNNI